MKEVEIRGALIAHVETMVPLLSVPLPVQWPNMAFKVPNDGKWIEVIRLPNDPLDTGWGENDVLSRGVFRIGLHWPLNTGEADALALAEEIASHFHKGLNLFYTGGTVYISGVPAVQTPFEDGQGRVFPVSMRYQSQHG